MSGDDKSQTPAAVLDRLAHHVIKIEGTSGYHWDPYTDLDMESLLHGMVCPAFDPNLPDIPESIRQAQVVSYTQWKKSMSEKVEIMKTCRMQSISKFLLELDMDAAFVAFLTPEIAWSPEMQLAELQHVSASWPVVEPMVELAFQICAPRELLIHVPRLSTLIRQASVYNEHCTIASMRRAGSDENAEQRVRAARSNTPPNNYIRRGREVHVQMVTWFLHRVPQTLRQATRRNAAICCDCIDLACCALLSQTREFARHLPEAFRSQMSSVHNHDVPIAAQHACVLAALECSTCCALLWLEGTTPSTAQSIPISMHACDLCGTLGTAHKRCSRCACAWYCSRACQKQSWPAHKKTCTASEKPAAAQSTLENAETVTPVAPGDVKATTSAPKVLCALCCTLEPLSRIIDLPACLASIPSSSLEQSLCVLHMCGLATFGRTDWIANAAYSCADQLTTEEGGELGDAEWEAANEHAQNLSEAARAGEGVAMMIHMHLQGREGRAESLSLPNWPSSLDQAVRAACLSAEPLVNRATAATSVPGMLNTLQLLRDTCLASIPIPSESPAYQNEMETDDTPVEGVGNTVNKGEDESVTSVQTTTTSLAALTVDPDTSDRDMVTGDTNTQGDDDQAMTQNEAVLADTVEVTAKLMLVAIEHHQVESIRLASLATLKALFDTLSDDGAMGLFEELHREVGTPSVTALLFQIAQKRITAALTAACNDMDMHHSSTDDSAQQPVPEPDTCGHTTDAGSLEHTAGTEGTDSKPSKGQANTEYDDGSIWLSKYCGTMVLKPLFSAIQRLKGQAPLNCVTQGKAKGVLDCSECIVAVLNILRFMCIRLDGRMIAGFESALAKEKQLLGPTPKLSKVVALLMERVASAKVVMLAGGSTPADLLGFDHIEVVTHHLLELC